MKKRIFSILLCLCMVLMLFPVTALAVNDATELQDLLGAGGVVELTKDYSIDTKLIVDKTVTLDLNGHVIKMTGADGVIRVDNNISLTLQDSNPTAAHTGDNASLPAGGVITGGNSEKGGGVFVGGGSFTMTGGTIFGCAAFGIGGGGGVYVGGGSFTMTGGAISGCSSNDGGGGVFVGGGSFTMIGGTISDCSATNGGDAIAAIDNSTINANGGTIYSEVASFGQILNTSTSGCTKFYGEAKNLSTIHGSGTISGGIYYGEVSNRGTISGGFYYNSVMNYGTISGGIYYDSVYSSEGNISGKTVTFVNGDNSRYASEVVADGSKVVAPTEPEAPEGMTFAGWYIDKELTQKYKFGNTLSDNIILYAGGFEPILTLTVPFTTTVKLGGSEAPGKTTFELAVVGANADEEAYKNVTVSASVTTNGAGSYEGTMTFKGTFQQLQNMLGAGVFVQQVNAGAPNWTYDDTVWGVRLENKETAVLAAADDAAGYTLRIYPATLMTSGNGSYYVIDEENPVDEMQFTNTYTYSAPVRDTATIIIGGEKEESKPVEENPNTGAPVAANMSTLSALTLAAAVAVLKTRKY